MDVGVFDHLDRNDLQLREFYEERLRLVELYDRAGFFCYHIAEHHVTPLGLASSPSVFLSAVAQRTKTLNFGPLVYTLPMHHPIGLIEEICMLDQMSGGRLQVGTGKGISPFETAYFGVDPDARQAIYLEALEVVRRGLTSEKLSFQGSHYDFKDVPMELEPFQKPHPPFWMGVNTTQAAEVAARTGCSFVTLSTATQARALTDSYRSVAGPPSHGRSAVPRMGLGRFVIIAPTDDEALDIARRTYPKWHAHYHHLYHLHGTTPVLGNRPADFDQIKDGGRGIAGSPTTVARMLREQLSEAGANYFVGQFAFGDLSYGEVARTIELFAEKVMPELSGSFETEPAYKKERAVWGDKMKSLASALAAAAAFLSSLLAPPATAQTYPSRTVTMVVPYPAGGAADILTRVVGDKLQAKYGQPFITENRPGATGSIGATSVARAEPDGHTLLSTPNATIVLNPFISKNLRYDAAAFVPVIELASAPLVIAVRKNFPAETVGEFLDYARRNPDKLNYASQGVGGGAHLATLLLQRATGIKMVHVPFTGAAPALQAVSAGQVDLFIDNIGSALSLHEAGNLKILAVGSAKRVADLPQVPTLREAGVDLDLTTWFGLFAPPATPDQIVAQLNGAIEEALKDPGVIEKYRAIGLQPSGGSSKEFASFLDKDRARWKQVIEEEKLSSE